jgi:hypothetical protein
MWTWRQQTPTDGSGVSQAGLAKWHSELILYSLDPALLALMAYFALLALLALLYF